MDKTTPPSGDDRYDTPPSKPSLTRRAYGPTRYGMGRMTPALTFKTGQATKGLDLTDQGQGHWYHDKQIRPMTWEWLPAPALMPRRHQENMRR
jgi:hypothetical protein